MSDVFWAALIAAVSGLVGATLSAFFTYRITQRQTDVQVEGRRRDRLIQARTIPLTELRESLSRNFGLYSTYLSLSRVVQDNRSQSIPVPEEIEQQRDLTRQELLEESSRIPNVIAQIADQKLLSAVKYYQASYSVESLSNDAQSVADWIGVITAQVNAAASRLIPINQRIEELLSGEDLT